MYKRQEWGSLNTSVIHVFTVPLRVGRESIYSNFFYVNIVLNSHAGAHSQCAKRLKVREILNHFAQKFLHRVLITMKLLCNLSLSKRFISFCDNEFVV